MQTVFRLKRAALFLILLHVLLAVDAHATREDTGTFGATFLQIPVGGPAMTVPGVLAGMRPDASLMFSNPAALCGMSSNQVYLTRANWLEDMSLNAVGLVVRMPMELKWSLGSRLLYSGGLQGFDNTGQLVAEESYYDAALSTGVSRMFPRLGLGLGFGVTYLREHLPMETGKGFVYSVGATYERGPNRFEVSAQNLGGTLEFEARAYPVDSRYTVGYGRSFRQDWGRFDVGTELTVSQSDYQRFQVGAAYIANPFLTLRTGFYRDFSAPTQSRLPVSAGFGVHLGDLTLDYAFTPQEYFSTTHTLSFAYSFGAHDAPYAVAPPRKAPANAESQVLPTRKGSKGNSAAPNEKINPTPASPPAAAAGNAATTTPDTFPTRDGMYALVAGIHGRIESAQAEMRALHLLKIPAVVETSGSRYRVLIGRFDSGKDAETAAEKYRKKGHVFNVVTDGR